MGEGVGSVVYVCGCRVLSTGYGRLNVMHFLGSLRMVGENFRGRWRGEKSSSADVAVRDWVGFLPPVELHTQVLAVERCWRVVQCSLGRNRVLGALGSLSASAR